MGINDYYEEITESEANFLIDIYESVSSIVRSGRPVTLVGIAYKLNIKPTELADYLPQIVTILDKVEEEYEIRQSRD
jgi:hypothetical protein